MFVFGTRWGLALEEEVYNLPISRELTEQQSYIGGTKHPLPEEEMYLASYRNIFIFDFHLLFLPGVGKENEVHDNMRSMNMALETKESGGLTT